MYFFPSDGKNLDPLFNPYILKWAISCYQKQPKRWKVQKFMILKGLYTEQKTSSVTMVVTENPFFWIIKYDSNK